MMSSYDAKENLKILECFTLRKKKKRQDREREKINMYEYVKSQQPVKDSMRIQDHSNTV